MLLQNLIDCARVEGLSFLDSSKTGLSFEDLGNGCSNITTAGPRASYLNPINGAVSDPWAYYARALTFQVQSSLLGETSIPYSEILLRTPSEIPKASMWHTFTLSEALIPFQNPFLYTLLGCMHCYLKGAGRSQAEDLNPLFRIASPYALSQPP